MSYTVVFTRVAETQLKKLDRPVQERIVSTLERIRVRPHRYAKRLVGVPYYRVRAGDYRIIIDIRDDVLLIMVLEMGHRRSIYSDAKMKGRGAKGSSARAAGGRPKGRDK